MRDIENNKLISVILSVCNTPFEYLQETVDSILGQTYGNIEFVIVNSDIDNDKICCFLETVKKQDNRVSVINLQEKKEYASLLNTGLNACRGDYIAVADAGDVSVPERIEIQAKYLDDNMDVCLVQADYITRTSDDNSKNSQTNDNQNEDKNNRDKNNEDKNNEDKNNRNNQKKDIIDINSNYDLYKIESLFGDIEYMPSSFMFRGNFIREHIISYPENVRIVQNYGIITECLKQKGEIRRVDKALIMCRPKEGMASLEKSREQLYYQAIISEEYVRFLFPELSNEEVKAFAHLKDYTCSCGIRLYKESVNKVIAFNKDKNIFNQGILEKKLKGYRQRRVRSKILEELNCRYENLMKKLSFQLSKMESDEKYLSKRYERLIGEKPDFANPETFNEKLQWLKLNERKPLYGRLADKYEVKSFIKEEIGEKYGIPTLGVWDRFEDIDFDSLPDRFVLKCTHDSGSIVVVKDKSKMNKDKAGRILKKGLKSNYYWYSREWVYKKIKPRIIAEPFLDDGNVGGLVDYKVHCFEGKPLFIEVIGERDFNKHTGKVAVYNFEWEKQEWSFGDYPFFEYEINKPQMLGEIYDISVRLASKFKYIRLDYYCVDGQVIIGEITFYPSSGFNEYNDIWNRNTDLMLGNLLPGIGKK